jgi:phosphoglycolate phosphatase-like HAD superfamily hydrolase
LQNNFGLYFSLQYSISPSRRGRLLFTVDNVSFLPTSTRIRNVLFSNTNKDAAYQTNDIPNNHRAMDRKNNGEEEILPKSQTFLPLPRDLVGVIFDMDGTLIQHCIDFADMRNRIYQIADSDSVLQSFPIEARRGDVLELYQSFSDLGKTKAKAVFDDIETKAIQDMTLMEHVGELCHFLDGKGIQRAVLTRNVQRSVNVMHKMLWDTHSVKEFYPSVSRDTTMSGSSLDEEKKPLPSKPSPEPIFHICNIWGCSPEQVIMVGDSAADDITAAYRANCGGRVLLRYNGKELDNDAGGGGVVVGRKGVTEKELQEREPTLVIENLGQLLEILKRNQN